MYVIPPLRLKTISTLSLDGQAEVVPLPRSSSCTGFGMPSKHGIKCTRPEVFESAAQLMMEGGDFNPQDTIGTENHNNVLAISFERMSEL
jgi:hypothetical protein